MNVFHFLKKENEAMLESYGITIFYLTGKKEEFFVVNHMLHSETHIFEFVTKEDGWNLVPLNGVLRIEFDKQFSKLMGLRNDRRF